KKVLLGLSGGVDSAVAAHILVEQGYDVTCAFMRNWDAFANNDILGNPTIQDDICPQEQDYADAQAVADKLGLPLLRIDYIKEYWDYVFKSFLVEYEKGRTPNPDILCNKYIKFDAFLQYAMQNGFDYVATGHYARVEHGDDGSKLLRGMDGNKDQTYFLAQVSQEAISKTLFPIGPLEKPKVRALAEQLDLIVAKKKDSTGICFIGERNFRDFLKNYLPSKEGKIVDLITKEVVGKHTGVLYYTIGQRKGLGIGGDHGRWFVVHKDVTHNVLYVVSEQYSDWLNSDACLVSGMNLISDLNVDAKDVALTAKFRYRQPDNEVSITMLDATTAMVTFKKPIAAVTCGQEAVFYKGDICLGGGVIDEIYRNGVPFSDVIASYLDGKTPA
ncbi:MAG: tRNA 2-thiouridine(34) synthase MnmA, partial [Erysipelotrichaceae bacterium]